MDTYDLELELTKELEAIDDKLNGINYHENAVKYSLLIGEYQGIEYCLRILRKHKGKEHG